jgi:hypothetical protein
LVFILCSHTYWSFLPCPFASQLYDPSPGFGSARESSISYRTVASVSLWFCKLPLTSFIVLYAVEIKFLIPGVGKIHCPVSNTALKNILQLGEPLPRILPLFNMEY